jgi:mannose-6-phosphate isomerase-like protein (cupin superfamily)
MMWLRENNTIMLKLLALTERRTPMQKKHVPILLFVFAGGMLAGRLVIKPAHAAEKGRQTYTIENCVSEFSLEKVKKSSKGWTFWHVPRELSPTFNFKISHVRPQSANHAAHVHTEEEIFYILEGTAAFNLDGKTKIVGAKSTLFCPKDVSHGIRNAGNTPLTYAVIKANYPEEK